jgi:hypothetical protein
LNTPVPTDSVHCVVTSCESPVAWRRVLQFRQEATGDGPGQDDPQGGERLVADVSVYFCTEHLAAEAHLDEAEPFPPESSIAER